MKRINSLVKKNIANFLSVFIILQPILDSLTAICVNYLKINITLGAIVRLLFLLFLIYYFVFLDKSSYKKNKMFFLMSLFAYLVVLYYTNFNFKSNLLIIIFFNYFSIILIKFLFLFLNCLFFYNFFLYNP